MKIKFLTLSVCTLVLTFYSCKKNDTVQQPVLPPLNITAISPASGPKNTVVTVSGKSFGTVPGNISVSFNGMQAIIQTVSDTLITAVVPAGAGTGTVKVMKNSVQSTGPVFNYWGAGTTTNFAGSGNNGYIDGAANIAEFRLATGVARDAAGNLFVADRDNYCIRKITPAGIVTTFAGGGTPGFVDGTGTAAKFNLPFGITIDASGNLYVGEINNNAIRKITPAGVVTTLAGNPNGYAGTQDGYGSSARFNSPVGLTTDAAGNVYVADFNNHRIRKVAPDGFVTTLAGNSYGLPGFQDGTGSTASFYHPIALAFDPAGNLIIADYFNHAVRKMTPANVVTTIAGNGTAGTTDGTGSAARFDRPASLAVDNSGTIYICDANNNTIRKITASGAVSTFVGDASGGNSNGTVTTVSLHYPLGLCADFTNNYLFVADYFNNSIRKINLD
jgi:IPT/TIG domain/NHL repeat